jgi:hypothetical protein
MAESSDFELPFPASLALGCARPGEPVVQQASTRFQQGTGQGHLEARHKPRVRLRTLYEILHKFKKPMAARAKLYHACSNTVTEKLSMIKRPRQSSPQRQRPAKVAPDPFRV